MSDDSTRDAGSKVTAYAVIDSFPSGKDRTKTVVK
jgi:hypothetical protein